MVVGRRANWKGGEMGRQTEENDEKVVVGHGGTQSAVDESAVQPVAVDYTCTMSDSECR